MKYGKIIDGELISAPIEIYGENNLVIELDTHEDYISNGYKVVITKKPSYNKYKYDLFCVGFLETENIITVQYELKEKEKMENDNSVLEEFIAIYNEEINDK